MTAQPKQPRDGAGGTDVSPEDIRADLNQAHHIVEQHGSDTDRATMLAIGALTEAVLHLADIIGRDRVF